MQSKALINVPGAIFFGDDPSGFVYAETLNGTIVSMDSSSGEIKIISSNVDDFFSRLIFGKDASRFAGDDWADGLKAASLI